MNDAERIADHVRAARLLLLHGDSVLTSDDYQKIASELMTLVDIAVQARERTRPRERRAIRRSDLPPGGAARG
jgi:hypothetical protein